MKRSIRLCAALSAAALALFVFLGAGAFMQKYTAPPSMQNTAQPAQPDGTKHSDITLFPELHSASIRFVSVRTPERSFQFHMDDLGAVSVNGTQADSEIFSTLLDQIAGLPVDHTAAFPTDNTQLLLTLEVHTDHHQHTAHFYGDASSGLATHIICGAPDAPQYRRTESWRVGTLVMTCEGTRILDAHGNETPASLSI